MSSKFQILLISLIVLVGVYSSPVERSDQSRILRNDFELRDDGYKYEYETSDGQTKTEEAVQKYTGVDTVPIMVVYGSYSYVGPDGVTYKVEYVADENGFRPVGVHIPGNRPEPTEQPSYIPANALLSLVG